MKRLSARVLSLCAALLLAPAARAGDKEDALAQKAFLEAYGDAVDERGRVKAVESLSGAPEGIALHMILGKVLPKDPSPAVQAAAIKVLRGAKDEKSVKALLLAAQEKGDWDVRGPVLEALGGVAGDLATAGLLRCLSDSDTRVLSVALFALAERRAPAALEKAKALLVHGAWQVRLGAAEVLAELRDAAAVPWLVDRVEEESGRLREDMADALKRLTGKDYGSDPVKWRAYAAGGEAAVKALGADPKPPAPGAPGGPPAGEQATAGGRRVVGDGVSAVAEDVPPTYYGLKVWSDRVVFVIDLSLSMLEEMVIDKERMIRETGAVASGTDAEGGKGGKKEEEEFQALEWWKIRTRMDFARSQLKYVISRLKRDQSFDIVWFSESVVAWQGGFVPATPANRAKALAWVESLKCEAGTNTWGGLMKAYNLVGKGGEEENFRRGADTIFFLSDGEPSIGDIKDKEQILAAIGRIHAVRRVKIHVVQIGTSIMPFMQRLASLTGGEFRFWNAKGLK